MRPRLATGLEGLALALACLTVVWGPLAQGSTFGWGLSGLVLLGCLTLAVTLLALGTRGQVRVANPWWVGAALAFLAWVWASTGWAPYKWEAFRWAGVWTAVIGTAACLHLLATTRGRQMAVLTVMVLTGAAALALAALQTRGVFVPGFEYSPGAGPGLVTGPYFNPSHFSGFLIPVAALLVSLILFTRPHLHTLALAGLLVALHWLNLKTDSSSIPAVLLATGLPVVVWVWTKQRVVGALLTVIALGGLCAASVLFLTPGGQATFARYQQQVGLHNNWAQFLEGRRAVWRYGRELARAHPLRGVGIGNFVTETAPHRRPARESGSVVDARLVNYAHNDALQLAAELGWTGVALFALLLLTPFAARGWTLTTCLWSAALPALALAGTYDAHMTVIPGTMIMVGALCGLAASRLSPRARAALSGEPLPLAPQGPEHVVEVNRV